MPCSASAGNRTKVDGRACARVVGVGAARVHELRTGDLDLVVSGQQAPALHDLRGDVAQLGVALL